MSWLTLASICCIPLKLSWTYIVLSPAILLFLYQLYKKEITIDVRLKFLYTPYALFFIVLLLQSPFTLYPDTAFFDTLKAAFFSLSIPLYFHYIKNKGFLLPLFGMLTSQTVASVHSVVDQVVSLPTKIFVGAVSESGQLALSVVFLFILLLHHSFFETKRYYSEKISATFLLISALLFSFLQPDRLLDFSLYASLFVLCFTLALFFRPAYKTFEERCYSYGTALILPLMMSALFANMKRGPLLGVFASLLLYVALFKRKVVLPLCVLLFGAFFTFSEFQQRLLASIEHFFIQGGRYELWTIGYELTGRYPFGLGLSASEFLQQFSEYIPKEHEHFHNNVLNILIECGWLPLCLLAWFFFRLCYRGMRDAKTVPAFAAVFALLSLQLAGLVEYNFGDSEVLLLSYVYVAILAVEYSKSKLLSMR